jgi:hypothetical protein
MTFATADEAVDHAHVSSLGVPRGTITILTSGSRFTGSPLQTPGPSGSESPHHLTQRQALMRPRSA